MSTQLRFVSRTACIVGFGLMALMSGAKAQAQGVTLTAFGATASPGGYDHQTDTVNVNIAFNASSTGSYGYGITTDVLYYSGPYASGTLLQSTTKFVYSAGGPVSYGVSNASLNMDFNTPASLRASEPAGTQSFIYVYHISGGGGGTGWGGMFSTYGGPSFLSH
ncbi:MAG: hypothetical protein ABIY70_27305 [Capsulimonas sp.]|uniref:hypothetical protein n=1 Tax=Capsulimonas sp. TaxID=2494211 RepID=UPI003267CA73